MIQEASGVVNVVSPDGTPVMAYGGGHGPPLLAVHGTGETSVFWKPLVPYLQDSFTAYAMQRRGRGKSGDSMSYALANEAEDVAALADAIGEPVAVFGHAFGANCALEAAYLTDSIGRLILYEPRVMFPYSDGVIDEMEALVSQGAEEEVLLRYFVESDLSIEDLMMLRDEEDWTIRFDAVRTVPRECRADAVYGIDAERAASLKVPTLLLQGSDSSEALGRGVHELSACVREALVEKVPGNGPAALRSSPEAVTKLLGA